MSHLGHRQRLRERFTSAPESLPDYEILELLLGHVLLRRDTKPLAKAMIERFGSMRGILRARPGELEDLPDIGPGVRAFLHLLREFMARVAESPLRRRELFCSSAAVADMARLRLGLLTHEEVWVAYVDNRGWLIRWERAATGTVNSASVYTRNVMERALSLKATGVVLAHNHPAGNPMPSGPDDDLTRRMREAAAPLGIEFIDHIIVTELHCYSCLTDKILSTS